ncbi:hypothetical protein HaLaN_20678 [Haematococcus lacustris]|uniref:Uncharacterized protein n=1 Tax=Haematococcus lacustris TaxID=44745 RepID=A0A699ZWK3_HAELA|nr:hypothetical protein HaLaN_20678 [Haematococcus lacustris]
MERGPRLAEAENATLKPTAQHSMAVNVLRRAKAEKAERLRELNLIHSHSCHAPLSSPASFPLPRQCGSLGHLAEGHADGGGGHATSSMRQQKQAPGWQASQAASTACYCLPGSAARQHLVPNLAAAGSASCWQGQPGCPCLAQAAESSEPGQQRGQGAAGQDFPGDPQHIMLACH